MPYITQEDRKPLNPVIQKLFDLCMDEVSCDDAKGRINFCITKLIHLWVLRYMKTIDAGMKKYKILNDAYGIVSSAAAEFYGAVVLGYERLKREDNGPVSQLDANDDGHAENAVWAH